jgi:hypothetical protein
MKKSPLIIIIIVITASIFLFYFKKESPLTNQISESPASEEIPTPATSSENIKTKDIKQSASPMLVTEPEIKLVVEPEIKKEVATSTPETKLSEINLDVPFSSQAPYSDWSEPYQNACEETASLMVYKYYQKETLTPAIAKQEILDLVAWENKTFGYYEDTTAQETAQILQDYYDFKRVDVVYNPTIADIKAQILAGRPVILPVSGQMLGNPNFKAPGPIYHMLVVKGITENGDFITNDSGTRKGHDYIYKADVLYKAIHDAPQGGHSIDKTELNANRKAMIVVYPN